MAKKKGETVRIEIAPPSGIIISGEDKDGRRRIMAERERLLQEEGKR